MNSAFLPRKFPSLAYALWRCLVASLALLAPPAARAQRITERQAPPFYLAYINLNAAETVTLDTTGCTPGTADPVFHLLNGTTFAQLAFDDDSGGGNNARIVYTSPSTQTVLLFMRSYGNTTSGTCHVRKNGQILDVYMPVNGTHIATNEVSFQANDHLRSQHVPGGSVAPTLVKFSSLGQTVTGFGLGNAPGKSSRITQSAADYRYLLGTPWTRAGVAPAELLRPGAARVLANDHWADSDGDGLGDALELALQTCATLTPCASMNESMKSGKDTDRDGLPDGEEVFGVAGNLSGGADDIPFARWGANPLHKDVFVEVDYIYDLYIYGGENGWFQPGTNPFAWLKANPNRNYGFWPNGTLESWVNEVVRPFALAPALHIRNPDGDPGVAVHLDLGVESAPADEAKFGDFGGASARAVTRDFVVRVSGTMSGTAYVGIDQSWSSFTTTGLTKRQLATAIGVAAVYSGGQVRVKSGTPRTEPNGDETVIVEAINPGSFFFRQLSVPDPSRVSILDEDEGSLRSAYELEPGQFAANRRNRFRYAVMRTGGQTDGVRFTSAVALKSFVHELGHTTGLAHNGHELWNNLKTNCVPQHFSVMSYKHFPNENNQFSDAATSLQLNPASVREPYTFGAFDHSIFRDEPARYSASNSDFVDWNRNGVADLGTNLNFRAATLAFDDASCNAFSEGRQILNLSQAIQGPPDLMRFGARLYAFWASPMSVTQYRFATLGPNANKSCTGPADPALGNCLIWSGTYTLGDGYSGTGAPPEPLKSVTAQAFGTSVFVAGHTESGAILLRRFDVNANGTLQFAGGWTYSSLPSNQTSFPPELVVLNGGATPVLTVLYRAVSGDFRERRWTGSTWATTSSPLLDDSDNAIVGNQAPAAKAWPDVDLIGWPTSDGRTLALLPDGSKALRAYVHLFSSNRWTRLRTFSITSESKPIIEYRPIHASDGTLYPQVGGNPTYQGHFILGWSTPTDDPARTLTHLQWSRLYSKGTLSGLTMLPNSYLVADEWTTNQPDTQIALFADSTIDNMFGLAAWAEGLFFLPHADGAPDHTYTAKSDFKVMEDGICFFLRDAGGQNQGQAYCGSFIDD